MSLTNRIENAEKLVNGNVYTLANELINFVVSNDDGFYDEIIVERYYSAWDGEQYTERQAKNKIEDLEEEISRLQEQLDNAENEAEEVDKRLEDVEKELNNKEKYEPFFEPSEQIDYASEKIKLENQRTELQEEIKKREGTISEKQDLIQELENADFDEYKEILEWWLVSDYLRERLEEKGETVGEYLDLNIWGRTTSGQLVKMDSVIQEIANQW